MHLIDALNHKWHSLPHRAADSRQHLAWQRDSRALAGHADLRAAVDDAHGAAARRAGPVLVSSARVSALCERREGAELILAAAV